MLNKVAKRIASPGGTQGPWLPIRDNPYLHNLLLKGVSDPLDPHALWEHQYGGGQNIQESITGRSDRRLYLALSAHRVEVSRRDEETGRLLPDPRAHTDVLIRIPLWAWRAARFNDRIPIMTDELSRLHWEAFQNQLHGNRLPRYLVIAEERLADDEVLFQFGLGVFIPNPDDPLIGDVGTYQEGSRAPLSPWQSYEVTTGRKELKARPAGIYLNQKYLLFSNNHLEGTFPFPGGFGPAEGFMVIDLDGASPAVECSPGLTLSATLEPEGETGNSFCHIQGTGALEGQSLDLFLERRLPRPASRTGTPHQGTIVYIPETTTAGVRLSLAALALPRIDPALIAGLSAWRLRFDPDGTLSEHASGGIEIMGQTGKEELWVKTPGQPDYRSIRLPANKIDCGRGWPTLTLHRSPLPGFLAYLSLPKAIPLSLSIDAENGAVLGSQPDPGEIGVALTFLDQPGSLVGRDEGVLNSLVSRRFVKVRPHIDGLRIELLSKKYSAYVLDHAFNIRTVLQLGAGEVLMRPGEYLQLSLYLLRFDTAK